MAVFTSTGDEDAQTYSTAPTGTSPAGGRTAPPVTSPAPPTSTNRSSGGGGSGSGGRQYQNAARDLKWQIRALKDAINREFRQSRRQNIRDINLMLGQQLDQLKEAAGLRGASFLESADDAEKATADVQEAGFRNLVRERADSLTAILQQGAGETDAVRSMLMNARNWSANTSEANRAYFDTMQSINQGIIDLNIDTKATMSNAHMTAEGLRDEQWQNYYNRRSEAMTELGNLYASRASLLDQASEMGAGADKGKGKKGKDKDALFAGGGVLPGTKNFTDGSRTKEMGARKGMKKYYAAAANELGKSYVQKPLPEWIEEFEAAPLQQRRQENSNLAAAPTMEGVQRAQGATLRTWA